MTRALPRYCLVVAAALVWLAAGPARAQQILLDKPVRAGELTVFPDLDNPLSYYYVSDKPHLATDANGRPQFSFLRWVENVRTAADQPEAREGEGGGIVHALVELSVTEDQIRTTQQELQRVKPGAKIVGPVVYRSGKFALISSAADPQGNLSTQVLGVGKAPILDGQKAAVSILLTKLGAKVLWESFQTPTPDISFSFEMEMSGYRSPCHAVIEANFDQIYSHKAFGAGVASTYLAAEIKGAFDELTREGAIKVTQVGSDEKFETLIATAYNKIADMMFAPVGNTGTLSFEAPGGPGLMERASALLEKRRQEARAENEQIRRDNEAAAKRAQTTPTTTPTTTPKTTTPTPTPTAASDLKPPTGTAPATTSTTKPPATTTPATTAKPPATTAATAASDLKPPAGTAPSTTPATKPPATTTPTATAKPPATAASDLKPPTTTTPTATSGTKPATPEKKEEVTVPALAVVATFEMKRVRQTGNFRIDLNKFTTDSLTLRFDENIGDLRSLFNDTGHFRQVNLDDPLYRQREIVAFVDGLNTQDFGQFINFVSVHLRKKHAGGAVTDDEVRIDRNNFNQAGNAFKMLYGWKGDNDRRRWMEYEYQTIWSFFGGQTVEEPWQQATANGITLAPPYLRNTVEVEGSPDTLAAANVRLVTARLFYILGGQEQVKQVTLNPGKQQLSQTADVILPRNSLDYGYEINWRLADGRTVSSGRKTSSDAILFAEPVPAP